MNQEENNITPVGTDILLIAYAASSFLAFILAFSNDISPGQSAACFGASCFLAIVGMNISKETCAQAIELEDED